MARLVFPRWLAARHRWGVGVEFTCPHCNERLSVFFANPCDGFRSHAPIGAQLYHRDGTGLGSLTLSPEINFGEHGTFEIIRGEILYRLH